MLWLLTLPPLLTLVSLLLLYLLLTPGLERARRLRQWRAGSGEEEEQQLLRPAPASDMLHLPA